MLRALLIAALAIAVPAAAGAQPPEPTPAGNKPDKKADKPEGDGKVSERRGGKEKLFDFTGLELSGSMRMPQLLYFLERAQQELERASLKRRSFIPEMVRSIDEDAL